MNSYNDNEIVLKHTLATRVLHYCLVFGFLPAAITGVVLFLRPFDDQIMHLAMQIHIAGAMLLTFSCSFYFVFRYKRVVSFWREIFSWHKNDIDWMKVGGGYPQKILLHKNIPVPPMEKINSGQKMMGIMVFFGTIIIILSGLVLYIALPLVPKEIAWWADKIHLIVGLGLTICIFGGHIPLGLYNWKECICMFTTGTIRIGDIKHHNELWIKHNLRRVK